MLIYAQGWSEGFDGPGRRLVFYCKGCNFRCRWCGNPESIAPEVEMLYDPARSAHVRSACPRGAVGPDGALNRNTCRSCATHDCVNRFHNPAFAVSGEERSPDDLIAAAASRRAMWGNDGGVTFSGGEPTLQAAELLAAVAGLRRGGISVYLESNASTAGFRSVAPEVSGLFCDVKCVHPALHRKLTGADNGAVLENLRFAAKLPVPLTLRVPLISGVNATPEEHDALRELLIGLRALRPDGAELRLELLKLHHLGEPKYRALGLSEPSAGWRAPGPEFNWKDLQEL